MSRTFSALATASQNAQQTEEVWLVLLRIWHASITPGGVLRCVNNVVDIHRLPSPNLLTTPVSAWTPGAGASIAADRAYSLVTDATATGQAQISSSQAGLTSGTTYTFGLRIEKDAVGKATRFPGIIMSGGGGGLTVLYLDTSTGEFASRTGGASGTPVAASVIDDGTAWLCYISRSGETSYGLQLFPAMGAGSTLSVGNESNTPQGSVSVNEAWLWAGDITLLETYTAFPFQLDLPGEDMDQPAVAKLTIDNVDLRIIQAVRGLPSAPTCDFEVILASQPTVTEIGLSGMTMRATDFDVLTIQATVNFEEIFTEPVSLDMTPSRFPGMF